MKDVLVFTTDDRLSDYNWEKSKKFCCLLKPLKGCALELQKSDAGPGVAIKVIRFLDILSSISALKMDCRKRNCQWVMSRIW